MVALLLPYLAIGQKMDHLSGMRAINAGHYFRFNYDNDYFASQDRNYTQGINLELVLPVLRKNPVNFFLVKPKGNQLQYGLAIEHIGYAPNNIKSPEIQYGDRPFAAAIMLSSFVIARDTIALSRIHSSLSLGVLGPAAFGKAMQEGIHKATGNTQPEGWRNQIGNAPVVNYELEYERQIYRYRNFFGLSAAAKIMAGSLFTNVSVSANAAVGLIGQPFASLKKKKSFTIYAYVAPRASIIGYDATLQGGLLGSRSPYRIGGGGINRFTLQNTYGLVLQTKTLYFEYTRTALTREFDSGIAAKWGGIRMGFTF